MTIKRLVVPKPSSAPASSPVPAVEVPEQPLPPSFAQAAGRTKRSPKADVATKRSGDGKRRDLMQDVTDNLLQAIEEGTAPWQKTWKGRFGWPMNPTTGKGYHGINVLQLLGAGFQDPRWCSYEQAKKAGWQVRAGEKSSRIYFYKPFHKATKELDLVTGLPVVESIPILRSYTVFNLSQMDKAPAFETGVDHKIVLDDVAENLILELVEMTGAEVLHGRTAACYLLDDDAVEMPSKETFESDAHYYAALVHELAHWTGHPSRLNRKFALDKSSPEYAREELRAEIASVMLSLELGIPANVGNHEGYVAHYLKLLHDDKREIFRAAKDAETMMRFILRYHPDFREKLETEVRDQAQAATAAGAPDEFFDASLFDEFEGEVQEYRP